MDLSRYDLFFLIVMSSGGMVLFNFFAFGVLNFRLALMIYSFITLIVVNFVCWCLGVPNIFPVIWSMFIIYTVIVVELGRFRIKKEEEWRER